MNNMNNFLKVFLKTLANISIIFITIFITIPAALLGFFLDHKIGGISSNGLIFFSFCAFFILILISLAIFTYKKNKVVSIALALSVISFIFFCKIFGDTMSGV